MLAVLLLAAGAAAEPPTGLRPLTNTFILRHRRTADGFSTSPSTMVKSTGSNPAVAPCDRSQRCPGREKNFGASVRRTSHGFAAGLYCHTAANDPYRVTSAGRIVRFASLPERRTSDGALAFDTSGRFGFVLQAATGRSDDRRGGAVFAISARGMVSKIGSYPGPGGARTRRSRHPPSDLRQAISC